MSGNQIPEDHAEELGECFAAHAPGLFGYSCALTRGDHALADDLVQAAFMAAARQWPTMRCLCDGQRLRWLHTTVGNLGLTRCSTQARGLQVVEALSAHWSWHPEPGGKAVFAALAWKA